MNLNELYKEKVFFGELEKVTHVDLEKSGFSSKEAELIFKDKNQENQDFIKKYPFSAVISRERRTGKKTAGCGKIPFQGSFSRPLGIFLPAFAALGLMCFLVTGALVSVRKENSFSSVLASGPITEGVRIKGAEPRLFVYKKTGEAEATLLDNHSVVHSRDVLQVSYVSGGALYGAILSVDGNGFVTLHYPDGSNTAEKLENTGETALNFAYKLDDAPAFERFIFVTGNQRISLEGLCKALSAPKNPVEVLEVNPAFYVPESFTVKEVVLFKDQ